MIEQLESLKKASRGLRAMPAEVKNQVLLKIASLLIERSEEILAENLKDLAAFDLHSQGGAAFRDRLTLSLQRLNQMAESLRQVAALPDPVGEIVDQRMLGNGLKTRRVRSPLGVIFMIFESRPNVAVEAFSLGFKAGNAMILKGGKESVCTTRVLYRFMSEALRSHGVAQDVLWGIPEMSRSEVESLLQQKRWIDVVVPRGGDSLIEFVTRVSQIPVIKNDRGLCHVYVHEDADLEMAKQIIVNAKTQRPGVCNAMETLLVHENVAEKFLPMLWGVLSDQGTAGVEWAVCSRSEALLKGRAKVSLALPNSYDTEYLALKMSCRVVSSLNEALEHIETHGSRHSEAIITNSPEAASEFQDEVDAAAVYWNASTRFTDGFELGLGGELGISTQKLHVRGPVGLRELTSVRWLMDGTGQVRK